MLKRACRTSPIVALRTHLLPLQPGGCVVWPMELSSNVFTPRTDHWSRSFRADRYIPDLYDLYDLYDLAHVAWWEPYNLHDLLDMFPGLDLS